MLPLRALAATAVLAAVLAGGCSSPRSKEDFVKSGDTFVAQSRHTEAIVEYRNALRIDNKYADAHVRLAEAYEKSNQAARALAAYVRAADLLPDRADVQLKAAQYLLVARRFEDARTRAEKVLARDPKHVEAHLVKGLALAQMKDFDGALTQINEAIKIDPQHARSYLTLGALKLNRKQGADAEAAFRKAVEAQPSSSEAQLALAQFYWSTGRVAEAETAFRRAVDNDPKNVDMQRELAMFLLGTGRAAEAESALKAIAHISKDAPSRFGLAEYYAAQRRFPDALAVLKTVENDAKIGATAKVRMAAIDFDQNRRREAHRRIDEVLAKEPRHVEALVALARMFLVEGKLDEAGARAEAAIAADPKAAPAYALLADVRLARHEILEAIASLTQVVKLNPRAVTPKVQLADLKMKTGDAVMGLQLAEEVLRDAPDHDAARLLRARALLAQNEIPRAERELAALARKTPASGPVLLETARLHVMKRDMAAARRAYNEVLQREPRAIEALKGLVALDLADRRHAAARAAVDQRLQQTPNDPGTLLLAANTYAAVGDRREQEATLRRLITVDPASLEGYVGLATLYMRQGRLDEAKAEFEGIAKRAPKSVAAPTMIGVILEAQNRPLEAQKAYEQVLAVMPDAGLAANNLAWLYAEHGGNLNVALQLAQTAKQLLPTMPQVNDTLGWVYYKNDLATLAIPPLEASVQQDPANPVYRLHLGMAYAKAGDKVKALNAFDAALKQKPDFREAQEARKAVLASAGASKGAS